jgi:hypothetical protein
MSDEIVINPERDDRIDPKKLHYRIPDNLLGFKTIIDYLPVSIGLYHKFLPRDYFHNVFKQCKDYTFVKQTPNIAEYHNAYKLKIYELKSSIEETINRYKGQVKETDVLNGSNPFFKEERHFIIDKLTLMGDIPPDETNHNFLIKYLTTYPHPTHMEKNSIIEHIDNDIFILLSRLYEISEYALPFSKEECNSFKRFCENIIIHMRANIEEHYPKSIVNYSCFMYSIIGYPYRTPSQKIYSINNYSNKFDNKFHNVIIYMKNTDALISYLYDILFKDDEESFVQEEWILRLAYCLCMALLAYRSEYTEYQSVTQNLFGTK